MAKKIAKKLRGEYLDLEVHQVLSNPRYLERFSDCLVILDEVPMVPNLFQTLRGLVDRDRHEGGGKRCFLVLGSGSLDLLGQAGETSTDSGDCSPTNKVAY